MKFQKFHIFAQLDIECLYKQTRSQIKSYYILNKSNGFEWFEVVDDFKYIFI